MAKSRIEFSLSSSQIFLLLTGGAMIFILVFILGMMVGKGAIKGMAFLETGARSDIVKMKIDTQPAEEPVSAAEGQKGKAVVQNNITSKPLITFYDTLTKPNMKEEVLPVHREEIIKKPVMETPSASVYTIQVAAMKDKKSAEALLAKLKKFGYSVNLIPPVSGKSALYKVQIGTFRSREGADKEAERIKKNEGLSTLVVEK